MKRILCSLLVAALRRRDGETPREVMTIGTSLG